MATRSLLKDYFQKKLRNRNLLRLPQLWLRLSPFPRSSISPNTFEYFILVLKLLSSSTLYKMSGNFGSFKRQLNLYGFKKKLDDSFYHEHSIIGNMHHIFTNVLREQKNGQHLLLRDSKKRASNFVNRTPSPKKQRIIEQTMDQEVHPVITIVLLTPEIELE